MRALALILLGLLAAAPAATAAGAPATVKMVVCSPWQEGVGGAVTYDARMQARPGTVRMSLRFMLERRGDGPNFSRVNSPSLGTWEKSRRNVSALHRERRIQGLSRGAVYRAVVQYRWHGRNGKILRTATRRSALCRQPGGVPNLRIKGIESLAGQVEGTRIYNVTVINRGASEARGVGVQLRVDGDVLDEAEGIERLGPGEEKVVQFTGPICRKGLRATADPKRAIAESNEDDNVRTLRCV